LNRSNNQIKAERAASIQEDAEIAYERIVQDLERELKRKQRERAAMLDISPSNSYSFISAKEFDSDKFINDDIFISLEIKQLEDKLAVVKQRFVDLFGKEE
jgi:hypothetical protein